MMSIADERKFAFLGSENIETQKAIINFFIKLGASNRLGVEGKNVSIYYFIDGTNKISNNKILPEGYIFQLDTYLNVMKNQEDKVPEYVECIKSGTKDFVVGQIYNWPEPIDNEGRKRGINTLDGMLWAFKPSTKGDYEAQNAPKRLKKEDLVAGEIYIYDGTQVATYPSGPSLGIKGMTYSSNPKWNWCLPITHATEEQKALLRSEIEKNKAKPHYVPQVGDYVVMEKAGGWGYSPANNGCVAIVSRVGKNTVDRNEVFSIWGEVINPNKGVGIKFSDIPQFGYDKEAVFRKALPHEIPNSNVKAEPQQQVAEWSKGTYAVGIKGNFGIYKSSKNLVTVGSIFTIKADRGDRTVVVEESGFWVYKENLKWFATRDEAAQFSDRLKQNLTSLDVALSETPLDICKRRYKKGMKVRSAKEYGEYSGDFTITADLWDFTYIGNGVDYLGSEGWLYLNGKFADILEDPKENNPHIILEQNIREKIEKVIQYPVAPESPFPVKALKKQLKIVNFQSVHEIKIVEEKLLKKTKSKLFNI